MITITPPRFLISLTIFTANSGKMKRNRRPLLESTVPVNKDSQNDSDAIRQS